MPTKIEWCDETWNPVTGCAPISEGCANCYARKMATRLRGRFGYPQDKPFQVTFHEDKLDQPLRWKKPRRIFVCSMGDLFAAPLDMIDLVMRTIRSCQHHTFLILTKRAKAMKDYFLVAAALPDNCWLGVTVENQRTADERIPALLSITEAMRFVSCEPLLSSIEISRYLRMRCARCKGLIDPTPGEIYDGKRCRCSAIKTIGLSWVICGGETGANARRMEIAWAEDLRDQCRIAGVGFFYKGAGTRNVTKKNVNYRLLDGQEWTEFPRGEKNGRA